MNCGSRRIVDVDDGLKIHSYRPGHAVWLGLDVEPHGSVARELQQVFEEGKKVCTPSSLVSQAQIRDSTVLLTLPSAHSSISCNGSRAR